MDLWIQMMKIAWMKPFTIITISWPSLTEILCSIHAVSIILVSSRIAISEEEFSLLSHIACSIRILLKKMEIVWVSSYYSNLHSCIIKLFEPNVWFGRERWKKEMPHNTHSLSLIQDRRDLNPRNYVSPEERWLFFFGSLCRDCHPARQYFVK